jgi:hypothetical protein
MDVLFEEGQSINVIGTGNGELFTTKDQVQKLFSSDWLYWGDLLIKMDRMVHQSYGKHDLCIVYSDLHYHFEQTKEKDQSYLGFVKQIMDQANIEDLSHVKHQEMKAHYVLDHYLHNREDDKRRDIYPVVVVFLFEAIDEKNVIRSLTFTNPPQGLFPDERIHPFTGYAKDHAQNLKVIEEIGTSNPHPSFLQMDLSDDFVYLDVDGQAYAGSEAKKCYQSRINFYDELVIKENKGILYQKDNLQAWTFIGHVKKTMKEEELRKQLHQELMKTFERNLSDKEKMFVIRRDMSFYEKELALGEDFLWTFRVFLVLEEKNDQVVIKMLQLSYPMDMILEGKHLS